METHLIWNILLVLTSSESWLLYLNWLISYHITHVILGVFSLDIGNSDDRIVGGTSANLGQIPYIVSLRLNSGSHFCGGSIINPSWILTAAHCIETLRPDDLFVVAGATDLDYGGTSFSCQNLIPHPGYSRQRLKNDIALVGTATPIEFNEFVQPIPIARSYEADNSPALISGWGLLKVNKAQTCPSLPSSPKMFSIPIRSTRETCRGSCSFWTRQLYRMTSAELATIF